MDLLAGNELVNTLDQSFVRGAVEKVRELEKDASVQVWLDNPRFREGFSGRMERLINNVQGNRPPKED